MPNLVALWHCLNCGECCRTLLGRRFGMPIFPQEKKRLELLAQKNARHISILPLTLDWLGNVTLYQIVEEKCPFLDSRNRCEIYRHRPLLCRAFPLHSRGVGNCKAVENLVRRGFEVQYPVNLKEAGTLLAATMDPLLKLAHKRYNLNHGWETHVFWQKT